MPLDYRVLRPQRAVLVSATGIVTLSECEALIARLMEEPAIEQMLPVLVDARGITSDVSVRDIGYVATLVRMLVKRGLDLIAIAADPGPVLMLAKAFEVAARALGIHVEAFDTIDQARIWLRMRDELDPAPDKPVVGEYPGPPNRSAATRSL